MATKSTDGEISINAAAIKSAIQGAVEFRCANQSQEVKDLIVKVAIACIADEMDHIESYTQINKVVTGRLEQLVEECTKLGVEL
jgi:hypothetical protein